MGDRRDHGYAWVVLATAFLLNVLYASTYSTLGIFIVEFISHFRTSKTTITWIGGMQAFIGNISALLFGGLLLKRFGCRHVLIASSLFTCAAYVTCGLFTSLPILFIFFGISAGVGFIFFYTAALVSVAHWFNIKQSLASGIFMSGQSVGVLLWPPIVRWLIDLYTWQGALIVLGGIYLNGLVFGALLRKPRSIGNRTMSCNANETNDNTLDQKPGKNISDKIREFTPFSLFLLGIILQHMGHMSMFAYTPLRAEELHIDYHQLPLLFSVMGLTGLFCRPLAGFIGDSPHINRTVMYGLSSSLVGATIMISTQFKTFPLLLVTFIFFGIFAAGYAGTIGTVLVDIAGIANVEMASSFFVGAQGIGNILLHPIAGAILDFTGNSNIIFWLFGSLQMFGGVLVMIIPLVRLRLNDSHEEKSATVLEETIDVAEKNGVSINERV